MKNLNFVAGMTRRFVSAKRLIRYFSNCNKLVEHRAQSPVREVRMLAVWPSIAEGFPTASSRVISKKTLWNEETIFFRHYCWVTRVNEWSLFVKVLLDIITTKKRWFPDVGMLDPHSWDCYVVFSLGLELVLIMRLKL